ncbi:MAG: hypothetical protein ACK5WY_06810 [Holosporaceae bacterium]|nr:hypothetical protein [Rhodospirillaceae bacterium]
MAVDQVFAKGASAEKFYIHLFGSRLNGGLASISAALKDRDILEHILDQLVIEGKDYSDANSLFSGGKGNEDATQALLDAYNFSLRSNPDIDSRPAKKLLHSKAQKMGGFFISVFNQPSLILDLDNHLSNDDGLNDFYLGQFPSHPKVDIQPSQATQATQVGQSSTLEMPHTPGKLGITTPPLAEERLGWVTARVNSGANELAKIAGIGVLCTLGAGIASIGMPATATWLTMQAVWGVTSWTIQAAVVAQFVSGGASVLKEGVGLLEQGVKACIPSTIEANEYGRKEINPKVYGTYVEAAAQTARRNEEEYYGRYGLPDLARAR